MPEPSRFVRNRPSDLRTATLSHRYAHHVRTLPARLESLAASVHLPPDARVLDYGCADLPYRHFFPPEVEFLGADLPGNPHATIHLRADGTLPVADRTVDLVLSTQVLEHVTDPALYLSECFRVLRPGGHLVLSTHGIFIYHPDPVDLWRWTCEGLQRVVNDAGFEVERFEGIIGLAATGLQLFQDSLYYSDRFPTGLKPVLAFVMQSLIAVVDRVQRQRSRDYNAQVFGLVAVRPG